MEKPFDLKDLIAKLKESGLPVLEEQAEAVANSLFAWLNESAAHVDANQVVKVLVPLFVAGVQPLVKIQIDKIDGQPG